MQCHSSIPVIGSLHAGLPLLAQDNWEEKIELPSYLNADFGLRVIDNGMSWTGISDRDLALMKQVSVASHGQIVAVGVEDQVCKPILRFFVEENGNRLFRAANPKYEDIPFTTRHRIIGRLILVIKEPPALNDYENIDLRKEIPDKDWKYAIKKPPKVVWMAKEGESL